jgi:polyhydroxybutyrate depolymerase
MKKLFYITLILFSIVLSVNCKPEHEREGSGEIYSVSSSISIDGLSRTYLLNLPPTYYDSINFPLVIALHGTGGSASQFEHDYKFSELANDKRFVVVYPEGVKSTGILGIRTWNAGSCCNYAMENDIDDVKFIRELIDRLTAEYKIDPKRIYVTGMSNGGMMAYRLAGELSDKIAAIAVVSGTMVTNQAFNTSRPVPILHLHSALDTKVPPLGGIGIGGYYFPPVDSVLNVWSTENGCDTSSQIIEDNSGYILKEWSNCENNVVIQYYLTRDGGHAWPGGTKSRTMADEPSKVVNANELIWNFLKQYKLL